MHVFLPETCTEALELWDSGKTIISIDMGASGPGAEQAVQTLAIEIVRAHKESPTIPTTTEEWKTWADDIVEAHKASLGPMSSTQIYMAKNLAHHYLARGWRQTIEDFNDHGTRKIQISKTWPHAAPKEE